MSGNGQGWGNPAPAGLWALAVAMFTLFYTFTCPKEVAVLPLLGCWLMGGFIVQVIVAVIEFAEGNTVGGSVFTIFSAFFMFTGGLEMFIKYAAAANKWAIPLDAKIDAWAWAALAIGLVLITPAYFKGTGILAAVVIFLDIAVVVITCLDFGFVGASMVPVAAYCLLIAGVLALYLVAAIGLDSAYGRNILPITGPWA